MTCAWVRADSALASLTAASDNTCLPLMVSPRPRPSIATRVVSHVCATGGVGVQRVKGVFLRVAVGRRTRNVGGRNRNCGCTNGSPVGRRRVCCLLSCCGLWATLFRACARCGVCVGSRPVAHSDGHHFFPCSWSGALRCVPYCGALETSVPSLVLHWKSFFLLRRGEVCVSVAHPHHPLLSLVLIRLGAASPAASDKNLSSTFRVTSSTSFHCHTSRFTRLCHGWSRCAAG